MNRTILIFAFILGGFFLSSYGPGSSHSPRSEWIYPDAKGKLVYKKDARGNRIMDFSHAGYRGGGVALPDIPVKVTVQPPDDPLTDCTALIQDAIDQVSVLPQDSNGFRGAVLLMPGRYPCSQTITVSADGVALRGSGKSENGSVIVMSGEKHTAVVLSNRNRQQAGNRLGNAVKDEKSVKITEKYIPAGSISFTVADVSDFKAGDSIRVDMILLPWGVGDESTDVNVRNVRKDSAVNPLALDVTVGREIPDASLPVVKSMNGAAQFTLRGGGGVSAMRVNGFENFVCPVLERNVNGTWEIVALAGPNSDDSYTVYYNPVTGLYDFTFVVETP